MIKENLYECWKFGKVENEVPRIFNDFSHTIVNRDQPKNRILWPTAAKCNGKSTWEQGQGALAKPHQQFLA